MTSKKDTTRTETVLVTPELAREWLRRNVNNRPLNAARVQRLADAMVAGQWKLTHESVAFDTAERLADGQHRLSAIVLADVAVHVRVTHGVDPAARLVIDTGHKRRADDIMSMVYGEASARKKAALANAIELVLINNHARVLSAEQMYETVQRYRTGIEWAINLPNTRRITAAVRGALAYAHIADPQRVEAFGAALVSGANLSDGAPALTLSRQLDRLGGANGGGQRRMTALWTLRAVIAHLRNEKVHVLRENAQWLEFFARFYKLSEAA